MLPPSLATSSAWGGSAATSSLLHRPQPASPCGARLLKESAGNRVRRPLASLWASLREKGVDAATLAAAGAALGTAAAAATARKSSSSKGGLRYYRFHSELPHPVPARSAYTERPPGRGWPEQCPPLTAAQACGWDVINPFDIRFVYGEDGWEVSSGVRVESGDIEERSGLAPNPQDNCWQWDPNQVLPHRISPHVFPHVKHQVKVSTYLFLRTPPGWQLLMTDIPNLKRKFRIMSALLDTDWYFPAHPWHTVIELPRTEEAKVGDEVVVAAGEPLCRLIPLRRAAYTASEMDPTEFTMNYEGGQDWLQEHGRPSQDPEAGGALDIQGAYVSQQGLSSFKVRPL